MQVETYEVEEINGSEAASMAADSESIALCEKLGLKGQMRTTDKETDTRCPYRRMTALEELVYETLFPARTDVEVFSSGPIPLRVLQVLAHAKEIPLLKGFIVLHSADHALKDPVLVGFTGSNYAWNAGEKYLLARWGDALESLDKLAQKAKRMWLAGRKIELEIALRKVQAKIENIENDAEIAFLSGKTEIEQLLI